MEGLSTSSKVTPKETFLLFMLSYTRIVAYLICTNLYQILKKNFVKDKFSFSS